MPRYVIDAKVQLEVEAEDAELAVTAAKEVVESHPELTWCLRHGHRNPHPRRRQPMSIILVLGTTFLADSNDLPEALSETQERIQRMIENGTFELTLVRWGNEGGMMKDGDGEHIVIRMADRC